MPPLVSQVPSPSLTAALAEPSDKALAVSRFPAFLPESPTPQQQPTETNTVLFSAAAALMSWRI